VWLPTGEPRSGGAGGHNVGERRASAQRCAAYSLFVDANSKVGFIDSDKLANRKGIGTVVEI
jgi:hypothetical protein